ncbi:DoxX family protein [Nocardioides sp. J2M5]|uniref:DoxX family protein n=1 Tax=Nocardioides palaemonis TaxID=2829810 RepID=UPI001BA74C94|nr:DoxX family protein [Nocardioides palaemonis]MBS2940359.1 DoxX family protein [Nocardioides palaemonis]
MTTPTAAAAPRRALVDVALLVGRVALGSVMLAHGLQKLDQGGLAGTADGFAAMGIPAPTASAAFALAVELGGGVLLLLGALTPVVGVLWALNMAGAWWFVHRDAFFATDGGYELVLALAVLGLVLAATGPGRLSVDALVTRRRTTRREALAA